VPIERRQVQEKVTKLLKELSVAQQCSLSEVNRYGYTLAFVRQSENGKLAVVQLNEGILTINDDGEIDHQPDITLRH